MSQTFRNVPGNRQISYTILPVGANTETPPLLKGFVYNAQAHTVDVEFMDGSSCILHDVPPQALFLDRRTNQLKELAQAISYGVYRREKLN